MSNYKIGKQWSDKFLPEIKRHLGEFLLCEMVEEDHHRNTDLIVLKMESKRVACRVRRHRYFCNHDYRQEFTIRSCVHSGNRTELSKIIEGWGDYLFYGFSNEDETRLVAWRILSLNAFRLWFNTSIVQAGGEIPGQANSNTDGSSDFRAFRADKIPGCIVWESGFREHPLAVAA